MRYKFLIVIMGCIVILLACNYSYKITTSKKDNPVNVSIVKTEKGYDYYVGNELVNEFTNDNCDEKEMDLLKYIYDTSKEELDNKPKEERTKPKKKILVSK